jgi:hypothetical protein
VSEYVTRFTQLSRYAPDNVDTDEKKQDWLLNGLDDGLAYAPEARNFKKIQDMVDNALVLENQRGIMQRKREIQRTRAPRNNKKFHDVFLLKDLFSILVSSKGCKVQHKDFKLLNVRSSILIFSLLALHRHHRKGTTIHRILVLWDRATVVVRLDTMLIGVQGSRQSRL